MIISESESLSASEESESESPSLSEAEFESESELEEEEAQARPFRSSNTPRPRFCGASAFSHTQSGEEQRIGGSQKGQQERSGKSQNETGKGTHHLDIPLPLSDILYIERSQVGSCERGVGGGEVRKEVLNACEHCIVRQCDIIPQQLVSCRMGTNGGGGGRGERGDSGEGDER